MRVLGGAASLALATAVIGVPAATASHVRRAGLPPRRVALHQDYLLDDHGALGVPDPGTPWDAGSFGG
jgi:hypothetical protein